MLRLALPLLFAVLPAPSRAEDVAAGAALFDRYCASCHGAAARGDGPTASVLSVAPADLAALASANGGSFPTAQVIRRIDGREMTLSHGSPMPFYGAFFAGADEITVETEAGVVDVARPVWAIVAFLRSIQQ